MPDSKLLVFSDDWGRHPSSCQHLVRHLLDRYSVVWVNTIGMRPPRLDRITFRRGMEKLSGWLGKDASCETEVVSCELREASGEGDRVASGEREVGSDELLHARRETLDHGSRSQLDTRNSQLATRHSSHRSRSASPTVIDAKMWPWMTHRWDRWLNRRLLTRQLSEFADGATVITTIPIVADLVDTLPATRWLYYCVDDFAVWPGLDGKILGRLEDELLGKVDCIVAASDHLAEGIRRRGREAEVLTHGVDLEFWKREGVASGEEREKLRGASCELREERRIADCENSKLETRNSSPLILFWGVVDRRMNAEWVLALGDSLERGVIKLVGPQQDPDPRLAVHSRIEMPGPVEFEQLPRLAAQADVLIMPYADLPVTRAMQPLKLKEYLATEKPVVASRLPAVEQWSDCLQMVDSQQGFVDRVVQLVSNFDGSSQSDIGLQQAVDVQRIERLRQRLELESWAAKASQFERLAGLAATSSV